MPHFRQSEQRLYAEFHSVFGSGSATFSGRGWRLANKFAKRVEAGAVPVMRTMDGFRGYYLIAGGDDTIVAISLFTNQEVARTSTQTLMPWIKENLGPLLASPTEPTDGTVLIAVQA
jgi:hypothetical protein